MGLKRSLRYRDLIILGIAGAMGTGVFFSNAGMTAEAGPGAILSWIIGAIMYLFVGLTYMELGQAYPEAGGPSRYSLYTHGRTTNMINAFADLVWYLFIPPIEALASVEGINYFWPHLINVGGNPTMLGGIAGIILVLLFLPFNYYGIKAFARSTNFIGAIKIGLYVLAAIGFVTMAHFGNLVRFGGFTPFGIRGVWAAIPLAMFAYGGIRMIPDYGGEITSPKEMARSILWVVLGQTIIYILFALAFIVALGWTAVHLHRGAWASVASIPGNPFLLLAQARHYGWLIGLTAVVAILGPFVTGYIYQGAGSRILFAMSRSGIVSRRLQELNQEYAVPAWALVVFTVIGAAMAFIAAPFPSIYGLISDAVVGGYLGFSVNPVVMIARYHSGAQGSWSKRLVAVLAFVAASLVVYWSGWPSVPYAVILVFVASVIFGLIYHVKQGFVHALWYVAYMLFLVGMTYIGGVGAKSWVSLNVGSLIVVVVSVLVFLPWGVASRIADVQLTSEQSA